MRSKLERSLVGPAGEHYVLYRLYRQGLRAALAPPNSPDVDILVLSPHREAIAATIQVKTRTRGRDRGWPLSEKHERLVDLQLTYALVDFEDDVPTVYLVPCKVVADVLITAHQIWLATPGKGGRVHNDTPLRRLLPSYDFAVPGVPAGWLDEWRERWDLIYSSHDERRADGESLG